MHQSGFIVTAALSFLGVTTVLICLHELGHYLSARAFGLVPKAFSIGFGPEVAGFTDARGTRWRIGPIPLGGYCSFHGEMHPGSGDEAERAHEQSFARLARWKRALVIAAGPATNVAVCMVVLGSLFATLGEPRVSSRIADVMPNSPAAAAGLRPGDRLESWNGVAPTGDESFVRFVKLHPEARLSLVVSRGGTRRDVEVTTRRTRMVDRFGNHADLGLLGVQFDSELRRISNPATLGVEAVRQSFAMMGVQAEALRQLAMGERSIDEISGPVRLAKFTGEQYLQGWIPLVYFAGVLSVAIAFMNLLPVPGLDGGYLALYAVEGAMRRDMSRRAFVAATRVGYACVAVMSLFAFSNDFRVLLWPH